MDLLLHIFNRFWSLDSFPSISKTSSIISIHKMGSLSILLLPSGLSLSPPASQRFLNASLSRLFFFLESNFIFSPRHAGFRPGLSTLDQVLLLCQSISVGLNKPRPPTINFSKAFDSIWHPNLFHKFILAGLLLVLFVGLNFSFLIGAYACFS